MPNDKPFEELIAEYERRALMVDSPGDSAQLRQIARKIKEMADREFASNGVAGKQHDGSLFTCDSSGLKRTPNEARNGRSMNATGTMAFPGGQKFCGTALNVG